MIPATLSAPPRRAPSPRARALEGSAWLGLVSGLLAVAVAARPPAVPPYAALGPHDLSAWVEAICGSIGALTAAVNGVCIAWHRWGKPARKRRRDTRDTPPPGPSPHTEPRGGA